MTTRVVHSDEDAAKLCRFIAGRGAYPQTVTITKGQLRRNRQNRLSQRWYADIARQRGDSSHAEVRAECKRQFGVPILLAENEAFAVSWHGVMDRLTYEQQVASIRAFDLPVTRLMTVKQMTSFMEEMQRHWCGIGFHLTDPDALRYEEEFS
ncbi:hypothetical protein [Tropicimonas sp. IMCC34011]|uniref:hypothetical protein n=1 Tax=Tropicimonas sp. IMCC34011 TaxID=2248759 RepID=UPI000E24905D|nr:hypothetical protein [Tropicimonas sp. IMCC34011]